MIDIGKFIFDIIHSWDWTGSQNMENFCVMFCLVTEKITGEIEEIMKENGFRISLTLLFIKG